MEPRSTRRLMSEKLTETTYKKTLSKKTTKPKGKAKKVNTDKPLPKSMCSDEPKGDVIVSNADKVSIIMDFLLYALKEQVKIMCLNKKENFKHSIYLNDKKVIVTIKLNKANNYLGDITALEYYLKPMLKLINKKYKAKIIIKEDK